MNFCSKLKEVNFLIGSDAELQEGLEVGDVECLREYPSNSSVWARKVTRFTRVIELSHYLQGNEKAAFSFSKNFPF